MKTYTSRPVQIQAIQWDGSLDGIRTMMEAWPDFPSEAKYVEMDPYEEGAVPGLSLPGEKGTQVAQPTDYVIRGTHGDFYPAPAEVFEHKYVESNSLAQPVERENMTVLEAIQNRIKSLQSEIEKLEQKRETLPLTVLGMRQMELESLYYL